MAKKDDERDRLPFVAGSETSKAAAEDAAARAPAMREQIYTLIYEQGDEGLTCDEAEQIMNRRHQSVSARFNDLINLGRIKDSGRTRKTRSKSMATVYVITGRSVEMTNRSDWGRVTLKKLLRGLGQTGCELRREGMFWQLQLPGRPEEAYESFGAALQALGTFVMDA